MADIFISYSQLDKIRIKPIIRTLENQGWSLWWDQKINPGHMFDDVIAKELKTAKCVVVIWSKNSVSSEWVRAEAHAGAQRGVLVPVLIDDIEPPIRFNLIQSARLCNLHDPSSILELEKLVESIKTLVDTKEASETASRSSGTLTGNISDPNLRAVFIGSGLGILLWLLVYISPVGIGTVVATMFIGSCGAASTYHYIKYMPVPVSFRSAFRIGITSELALAATCSMLQYAATEGQLTGKVSDDFDTGFFYLRCVIAGLTGGAISLTINRSAKGY